MGKTQWKPNVIPPFVATFWVKWLGNNLMPRPQTRALGGSKNLKPRSRARPVPTSIVTKQFCYKLSGKKRFQRQHFDMCMSFPCLCFIAFLVLLLFLRRLFSFFIYIFWISCLDSFANITILYYTTKKICNYIYIYGLTWHIHKYIYYQHQLVLWTYTPVKTG